MGVDHHDKKHASSHREANKSVPSVVHDSHEHTHEHKHRKQIVNRLARIEGHMRATKEMTASGRDCSEILLQIAAIQKALDNAAKLLLKDHLEGCVVDAIQKGNQEQVLADLNKALNNYIR
ncbi:metal-sensing transcriptional repressor [Paenibacillus alkaliterrae]|uniref:metal-sensing transcriptional repressor n=1 Tax=Paenibacillus alkaliterrae TaxID=320909 RepID=UPI001F2EE998|nr:metal-sensing transcriptional repressor [Paenibacillus alkaliterrae]MCF2940190.1 metal-sensing transcriptional repressor [Paenibacillus alkaliterrae]